MAGSILAECRISVSQEEALASLGGGWERSGLYSLDETPSQNCSPDRVLQSLHAEPPASYEGDSGSESSESVDGEGDMRFTQEPVEWMSPPSSNLQADGAAKEDSYAAAFESDRSQSPPSQDWHGQSEQPEPLVHLPNFGVSAEFLTQPVGGVTEFQDDVENDILTRETIPEAEFQDDVENDILTRETIPEAEFQDDVENDILTRETIPEAEFQEDVENDILRREISSEAEFQASSVLLATIPEHAVEAPVAAMEFSLQPFTQPACDTQPPEHLPLNTLQEPASETQLGDERNGNVHETTLLDDEIAEGAEEPEPVQQGSGLEELVMDAPALDNEHGCAGEKMLQERRVDSFQLPGHEGKDTQQEHGSHIFTKDVPRAEVQRGDPGASDNAQLATQLSKNVGDRADQREQVQTSNRETRSFSKRLKRVNCAEEHHGRQKFQRIESSPVRARGFPKTVMDVVRSRSRSLSNSLVDDECNILSIIMRAGVSFPPFLHEKRSV